MDKVETGYVMGYHSHQEAGSRQLDAPLLRLDLAKEMAELETGETYAERGQSAKTLAKYPDLRVVLIALKRGVRLEEHSARDRISIQALKGRVSLRLAEQTVELSAGCLLAVAPGVRHDVEAQEDSAILVTMAWPPSGEAK